MKNKFLFTVMLLSLHSYAGIIPSVDFSRLVPETKNPVHREITNLTDTSITWQTEDCSSIKFDDYYFLKAKDDEYLNKLSPITDWQCVYLDGAQESYGLDYDPDVADEKPANEAVVYDEKNDIWKVKKRKRQYYKDAVPLTLYNITSPNAKGYMVIDENVNKYDLQKGITKKKEVSFCMIQKTTLVALCGQGNLLKSIDGKEVDLTSYFLKSLESMTISNPVNGK